MNQPMEAQRNQDPKLLIALGLKRFRPKPETDTPRIDSAHADDPPTSGSVYDADSPLFKMRQVDEMFEEWWQNRRNH
jgi:hypothetical protein